MRAAYSASMVRACAVCGLPIPEGARFCPNCGAAAGPLVGSAVLALAVAGGLAGFAEELLLPPQAARIRHPVAAITAHTGRSSGQCRQRIVAVCHTKGRARTDTASGLPRHLLSSLVILHVCLRPWTGGPTRS